MKFFLFFALAFVCFGQQPGTLSGIIVDGSGASIAHVQVKLSVDGRAPDQATESSDSGQFSFPNVSPGPYHLTFNSASFEPKAIDGVLASGESMTLPQTALAVATLKVGVDVTQTQEEMAEDQIKVEETQRLVALIPNYFANYNPDAVPLTSKQKFKLTGKFVTDPSAYVISGAIAGFGQLRNSNKGFGQGAAGYGKRYALAYSGFVTDFVINRAIMPSIFKQDPRYFYKGTGTGWSRFKYAVSRSLICQGDNKQPQFCYSRLTGDLATGFLTNIYVPSIDRNSNAVVMEDFAIGIGADALGKLFQEFVARKLTPKKN